MQITAPHFVAGVELWRHHGRRFYVADPAPIVHYTRGWTLDNLRNHCRKKGWKLEQVTPSKPPAAS